MQDQDFSGDVDYYTTAKEPGFDADWEYDAPTWPVIDTHLSLKQS